MWPTKNIFINKIIFLAPPTPKNHFWAFRQAVQQSPIPRDSPSEWARCHQTWNLLRLWRSCAADRLWMRRHRPRLSTLIQMNWIGNLGLKKLNMKMGENHVCNLMLGAAEVDSVSCALFTMGCVSIVSLCGCDMLTWYVGLICWALSQLCTIYNGMRLNRVGEQNEQRRTSSSPAAQRGGRGPTNPPPDRPIHSQTGEKGPTRDDPVHFDQRTWWKWCSMRTMSRS